MTTIQLIVTGQLELRALHSSLQKQFPEAIFLTPQFVDSITSEGLPELRSGAVVPSHLARFATAMVAAVDPGRRGRSPDLVMAVDDLELVNVAHPERVVECVRHAVRTWIAEHYRTSTGYEKAERLVRERCSFHMLAPMVEAYFFGEPAALQRAGAKAVAVLDPGRDLEDFLTHDPDYLAASASDSLASRHPKRYLQHLCKPDPYRETKHGRAALTTLDWPHVLAPESSVRFAHSLFCDIEGVLGRPPCKGLCHPSTSRFGHQDNVMRNC